MRRGCTPRMLMRQRYFKEPRKHTEGTFFFFIPSARSFLMKIKKGGCGLDDEDEKKSCLIRQRR